MPRFWISNLPRLSCWLVFSDEEGDLIQCSEYKVNLWKLETVYKVAQFDLMLVILSFVGRESHFLFKIMYYFHKISIVR